MTDKQVTATKNSVLRQRAAGHLKITKRDVAAMPIRDVQRLVQKLQPHQIELEMQNVELRRTQEELEVSWARYFDLYDLAPVGYFTLSEQGLILRPI